METAKADRRILVVNGPNLNMLGKREPDVYGSTTLADINLTLKNLGKEAGIGVDFFQSNHEGEIVTRIQQSLGHCKGIIINPAAYTHTSVAIRDAIAMCDFPVVEIHLSNVYKREAFRHKSMLRDIVHGQITGFGAVGYEMAFMALSRLIP